MADTAARREARRRKILENSENRLQRITGSKNTVQEEEPNNSYTPSNPRPTLDLTNEILPERNVRSDPTQPENELFDNIYSEGQDFLTQSLSCDLHKQNVDRENLCIDDVLETTDRTVRNEKFFPYQRQTRTVKNKVINESDRNVNPCDSIERVVVSTEASLLYGVFTSKWTLLILAVFVNILYLSQLQHFCGKNVFTPFFGLMLARLYLGDNESANQGSNLLSTALILCNVKPELVHNMSMMWRIFRKITKEFAIYIFSFVILYNLACYWNNIDVTISAYDSLDDEPLR